MTAQGRTNDAQPTATSRDHLLVRMVLRVLNRVVRYSCEPADLTFTQAVTVLPPGMDRDDFDHLRGLGFSQESAEWLCDFGVMCATTLVTA